MFLEIVLIKVIYMNDVLKIVLIRVYADLSNPGYYSVIHRDNCITILPVVEKNSLETIPSFMDPGRIIDKCSGKPLEYYYKFSKFNPKAIHNDPRIDLGFYTEEARSNRLPYTKMSRETIILFMSGLAKYPENIWFASKKEFRKIQREIRSKNLMGIYIIGGIVLNKVLKIESSDWNKTFEEIPVLMYSPHYYRKNNKNTVAFIGKGFYINPPLKIATLTTDSFKITRDLIELINRENVYKLIKQNFRKTSIIETKRDIFEKTLGSRIDYV